MTSTIINKPILTELHRAISNIRNTIRILLFITTFISLAIGVGPALANEAIEGMYIGTISPSTPDDAVTSFRSIGPGKVFAIYVYNDENRRKTQGKLSQCKLNGRVLQCRWSDKYGQGDWQATFSKDYKRFDGKWYEKVGDLKRLGSKGGHKWSGEQIFQ